MDAKTLLIAIAALLTALAAAAAAAQPVILDGPVIVVSRDGYTAAAVTISCPTTPCNISLENIGIKARWDRVLVTTINGDPAPAEIHGDTVYIGEKGVYRLMLGTDSLVDKIGGRYYLHIETTRKTRIILPKGSSIMLNETRIPRETRITADEPGLIIELPPGNHTISYTITEPATGTGTNQQKSPQRETSLLPAYIAAAAAGTAAAYYAATRLQPLKTLLPGKKKEKPRYRLDAREKMIIETLRELGEATPQEIMKKTGIPRSALYRRLSKLLKNGLIEKEQRGGRAYYRLKKK